MEIETSGKNSLKKTETGSLIIFILISLLAMTRWQNYWHYLWGKWNSETTTLAFKGFKQPSPKTYMLRIVSTFLYQIIQSVFWCGFNFCVSMQNSSQNVSVVRKQYFCSGWHIAEVSCKQICLLFSNSPNTTCSWSHGFIGIHWKDPPEWLILLNFQLLWIKICAEKENW